MVTALDPPEIEKGIHGGGNSMGKGTEAGMQDR